MGTADSCWGNYFNANEVEQGNEELVWLNKSVTVPFPHIPLLPSSALLLTFLFPSSPLLTFVSTWFLSQILTPFFWLLLFPLCKIQFFESCCC